jgi:DNA-binding NtrC family response regulator
MWTAGCTMRCETTMVLLVDDDDLFRTALASNLRDDGYQVQEYAETGSVPMHDLQSIDALLIDWAIERRSARKFVKRFHEAYPSIPVIVITAVAKQASERPADHITFLPKPLHYEALVETLGAARPIRTVGNRESPSG